MTSVACPQCGAALEVPSPPPSSVRCKYCRADTPVGSLARIEVDEARLDRALQAHATRSRTLLVGIGALLDAVALDPTGRVYVRDSSELVIFTPEGRFLQRFDPGELGSLRMFAIAGDGTLWVLTSDGVVGAFDPPTL